MKKILTVAVALMLVFALGVTVFAEEAEADYVIELQAFLYDDWGDAVNDALQKDSMGTAFAIALKPLDEVDAENTWYDFEITIPVDCTKIDISINCAAKGDNRWMDVTFNGETSKVNCLNTGDWGVFYENIITIENVKKGDYVLRLACPDDFDNDTIKTPNIDKISFNMYLEDYETVPVDDEPVVSDTEKVTDTEAPAETEPESGATTTAPTTEEAKSESGCGSAMGASAVIVMLVSALGCALIRRK